MIAHKLCDTMWEWYVSVLLKIRKLNIPNMKNLKRTTANLTPTPVLAIVL